MPSSRVSRANKTLLKSVLHAHRTTQSASKGACTSGGWMLMSAPPLARRRCSSNFKARHVVGNETQLIVGKVHYVEVLLGWLRSPFLASHDERTVSNSLRHATGRAGSLIIPFQSATEELKGDGVSAVRNGKTSYDSGCLELKICWQCMYHGLMSLGHQAEGNAALTCLIVFCVRTYIDHAAA